MGRKTKRELRKKPFVAFVGFLVLFEAEFEWFVRVKIWGHCTGVQTDTKLVYRSKT